MQTSHSAPTVLHQPHSAETFHCLYLGGSEAIGSGKEGESQMGQHER